MSLYLSLKYWATVHSVVWPFSCCRGNLKQAKEKLDGGGKVQQLSSHLTQSGSTRLMWQHFDCCWTVSGLLQQDESKNETERPSYVWWLAGLLVTLHTLYFLFICPQWVISTFKPGWNKDKGWFKKTKLKQSNSHLTRGLYSHHNRSFWASLTFDFLCKFHSLRVC